MGELHPPYNHPSAAARSIVSAHGAATASAPRRRVGLASVRGSSHVQARVAVSTEVGDPPAPPS